MPAFSSFLGRISMGYCPSHPCFQKGGASMSHAYYGSLLSGAQSRPLTSVRVHCFSGVSTDRLSTTFVRLFTCQISQPSSRKGEPKYQSVTRAVPFPSPSDKELPKRIDHKWTGLNSESTKLGAFSKDYGFGDPQMSHGNSIAMEFRRASEVTPNNLADFAAIREEVHAAKCAYGLKTGTVRKSVSTGNGQSRILEGILTSGSTAVKFERCSYHSLHGRVRTSAIQPTLSFCRLQVGWMPFSSVTESQKLVGAFGRKPAGRRRSGGKKQHGKVGQAPKASGKAVGISTETALQKETGTQASSSKTTVQVTKVTSQVSKRQAIKPILKEASQSVTKIPAPGRRGLQGPQALGEDLEAVLKEEVTQASSCKATVQVAKVASQVSKRKGTNPILKAASQSATERPAPGRQGLQSPQAVGEDLEAVLKEEVTQKRNVVVVESPAKAKTIEKYLGGDFLVLPTYGHVRDLAGRAGSVRPHDDYALLWEVPSDARNHVNKIKAALENAKCLILASDPDREGEAIAWHVCELMKAEGVLKKKKTRVLRVTFNEITKTAIQQAMQAPRDICMTLVTAYLARRALDYLIGFDLSPVLWRKLPGSKSAGRVQSAALNLICEREREIEEFVPQEYWTVGADVCCATDRTRSIVFPVRPTHLDGNKLERFSLLSERDANDVVKRIGSSEIRVTSVKKSLLRRNPPKPYITSTLQQDAQNKLGFGAARTMNLAQKLYEGVKLGEDELTGLITYMRTDGYQFAKEAIQNIRAVVADRYGDEYVPIEPRQFESKVKNAQEAHEAIRPTDVRRLPSMLADVLEKDSLALYSLIWIRTMACQMEQAVLNETGVDFATEKEAVKLRATTSSISFPGFMAALQDKEVISVREEEAIQDAQANEDDELENKQKLPHLQAGDLITVISAGARQHFTQPPPRFSEGSLVKKMEELGIGRPSTYAATLRTLQSRNYVKLEKRQIIPEVRGRMVTAFLSHFFPNFTDHNFTANLEEQLDEVSGGRLEWKEVLKGFWPDFHADVTTAMKVPMPEVVDLLQGTFSTQFFRGLGENGRTCPSCGVGKLTLKLSRYGAGYFFGCDSYPECRFKTNLLEDDDKESSLDEDHESTISVSSLVAKDFFVIGVDPASGLQMAVKNGPFGHYIQLGPDGKGRRCFRVPDGLKAGDITLEKALELIRYPVLLDKHPEDGEPIWIGVGRLSFYVRHRSSIAPFPKDMKVEDMSVEKALELLQGDHVKRRGRRKKSEEVNASKDTTAESSRGQLGKIAGKVPKKGAQKPAGQEEENTVKLSVLGQEKGEVNCKKGRSTKKEVQKTAVQEEEKATKVSGQKNRRSTKKEVQKTVVQEEEKATKASGQKNRSSNLQAKTENGLSGHKEKPVQKTKAQQGAGTGPKKVSVRKGVIKTAI